MSQETLHWHWTPDLRDTLERLSRLYRNSGLLYGIKYGNRGIWFDPRVLPVESAFTAILGYYMGKSVEIGGFGSRPPCALRDLRHYMMHEIWSMRHTARIYINNKKTSTKKSRMGRLENKNIGSRSSILKLV